MLVSSGLLKNCLTMYYDAMNFLCLKTVYMNIQVALFSLKSVTVTQLDMSAAAISRLSHW